MPSHSLFFLWLKLLFIDLVFCAGIFFGIYGLALYLDVTVRDFVPLLITAFAVYSATARYKEL